MVSLIKDKRELRRMGKGLLFISPWLIGYLLFMAYPLLSSLYYSFTSYDVISPAHWVGLQNYIKILSSDTVFYQAIRNTLYFTIVSVVFGTIVSFAIALLLNKIRYFASIFRTVVFLPSVLPAVAGTILFVWVLNPSYGIVNAFLRLLHIPAPAWFSDPHWSIPGLVLMSAWTAGPWVIIYLSALQGLPEDVYEAAELDGCKPWTALFRITIPLLSPVIFFNVIMSVIGGLQTFTQGFIAGGLDGAPAGSLLFYGMYIYEQAFAFFNMGYASALAWILFIVTAICTAFVSRMLGRYTYYEN
ncbi:carbohydrate ABC transporter permease [Alicyclobacillus fodiniaquatilis]|jgi:multiple sugar transport system permease protein|uniref:Carbohydrate ABC transporter permease n=1 Tax=Alicyclobacillus fodiniaquatilis TaxID=1661150 RepID=A0ABW4JDC4_9BACL